MDDYLSLQQVFPLLKDTISGLDVSDTDSDADDNASSSTLTVQFPEIDENGALVPMEPTSPVLTRLNWSTSVEKHVANPLSCSFSGSLYGTLGCFPIGLDASRDDFEHVLRSQQRLRKLNLLSKMTADKLHEVGKQIMDYSNSRSRFIDLVPTARDTLSNFANALTCANDEVDDYHQIRVYVGLDSGFHTPAGAQFWAVWEAEQRSFTQVIYISKSVQDLAGALLHTYLSKSSFTRYQCFLLEYGLGEHRGELGKTTKLPQRVEQDLSLLSSADLLLYLQHMQHTEYDQSCPLLSALRDHCEVLLIDVPTYHQLKKLGNMEYINGTVTDEQLVHARIKWYRLCRLPCLDRQQALALFRHIDLNFRNALWWRDHKGLDTITSAIERLTSRADIDSVTDFVLFCIFCAARKAGFEEVYIEVSDRNPLFNQYSDQSAAFAELFALGSRCEAYFDIMPSDMGILLSTKHRNHYNEPGNQPPMWIFNAPSFASAYAAAQTDIDPEQKASVMPGYRRFTFLSVFAIPALVGMLMMRLLFTVADKNRHSPLIYHRSWIIPQC